MTDRFVASPTEYRGVRFRSKSEAMFALWLDLESSVNVAYKDEQRRLSEGFICVNEGMEFWKYEPVLKFAPYFNVDFLSCTLSTGRAAYAPFLNYQFIEYKPSKPTKTYCEKFFLNYEETKEECERIGLHEVSRRSSARIFYGSIFNTIRGVVGDDENTGFVDIKDFDWLYGYEDEIRSYRFDLEVHHASH